MDCRIGWDALFHIWKSPIVLPSKLAGRAAVSPRRVFGSTSAQGFSVAYRIFPEPVVISFPPVYDNQVLPSLLSHSNAKGPLYGNTGLITTKYPVESIR